LGWLAPQPRDSRRRDAGSLPRRRHRIASPVTAAERGGGLVSIRSGDQPSDHWDAWKRSSEARAADTAAHDGGRAGTAALQYSSADRVSAGRSGEQTLPLNCANAQRDSRSLALDIDVAPLARLQRLWLA
jgi:hypothetical protein